MKLTILKTALAGILASAAMGASAVGRVADVNVVDRNTGQTLTTYYHRGEYWIAGQPGAKYSIQIRNKRGPRLLAVTSVDGLNVLTGESADVGQSGYVFEGGQQYGIEGWRKSDAEVAAFVFTASGDSYAQLMGKPRDVGVIGVALFRERPPVAVYTPPVIAAPAPAAAPLAKSMPAPQSAPRELADSNSSTATASGQHERSAAAEHRERSTKLGTAHGERENSLVTRTQFVRNSAQPDEIIRIRYDSHSNLLALGVIPSPRPQPVPNPFPGAVSYVPDPPARR